MSDPYHQRPRKWDNVLRKWRYLYWNEISDTQRNAELAYQNKQNQKLVESDDGKRSAS